jgi:succinoglycan biosynthesis transport protein ExoP
MTGPTVPPRPRPAAAPSMPVLRWLATHWLAILFCGTLMGGSFAAAAWTFLPAKAESYALLQVASAPSYVANQNDPMRARTDFATYLKTTAMLIKSDRVLNRALNDDTFGVAKLDLVKQAREPLVFLDEQVLVTFQDGNEVIRIGMKSENPDDAKKIVNAIQSAYMKEIVEREVLKKKELLEKVRVAKVDLSDTIKRKGGTVEPAGGSAAATAPQPLPGAVVSGATSVATPGTGDVRPVAAVVPIASVVGDGLRRALADQLVKKIGEYEEQLVYLPGVVRDRERKRDQVKKAIEKALSEPAKDDALAAAENDAEVQALRTAAKRARADYTHYKSLAANPDAPSVVAFRDRAAALDLQADQRKGIRAKEIESNRRINGTALLDQQLADAERELARVREQAEVAVVLRDRAKDELGKLPPEIIKEDLKGPSIDPAKTDLVAHNVLLDRVTQQEIGLDFELTSPPRVTLLQPASTAVLRDMKKQVLATVGAGLMGFALAGLVACGYEAKTRKLSALSELTNATAWPTVSVVPHAPTATTFRDPLKRTDVGEAIDKLRTYVTQSWLPKGVKSVAVTSPLGDEGKATVACGLAESLARAGVRTLLVDFDLRAPAVHRLLTLDNARGVCELLRDEAQAGDAVLGLPSGLYVLPAGQWTDATRHAAAGDRVKSLFAVLAQPFDCVVVHAHSLLTAAESVEVARRADAVLLCCQNRESRLPLVTRAAERLGVMGTVHAGVVYVGASRGEALC